mgnify:CR=1 FL=1
MTHTRYAFIKAQWHADIVDRALEGFCALIPADQVEVFDVPGAFEMPLLARDLAQTGQYAATVQRRGARRALRAGFVGVADAASFPGDGAPHRHLPGPFRAEGPRGGEGGAADRRGPRPAGRGLIRREKWRPRQDRGKSIKPIG